MYCLEGGAFEQNCNELVTMCQSVRRGGYRKRRENSSSFGLSPFDELRMTKLQVFVGCDFALLATLYDSWYYSL